MLHLSEQDRITYRYLLKVEVLKKVVPDRLPHELAVNGAQFVFCPDGDQFRYAYDHACRIIEAHRDITRLHVLTRFGGGLVLPADSPLHNECLGLHGSIFASQTMKHMDLVMLYAHAPCGAATEAGMSLAESLDVLCRAKIDLKRAAQERGANIKVACFLHIDAGPEEGRKTFFFPNGQWQLLTRHKPVKRGEPWPGHTSQAANR